MARIRSVKPEFWDDRKLAKRTSRDARLLYIGLWNLADEHSRLNGDPQWIKGQIFAYDDDLDVPAIEGLIKELAVIERVMPYEADGDPYLFLPKLAQHQRLEPDKVKSRLPAPPAAGFPPPPDPAGPTSGNSSSESRAGQPESRADQSERGANKFAQGSDESAPHADKPALLYVAGSREHVAGGRVTRASAREDATVLGCALLDEHTGQISPKPPRDVIGQTGRKIDSLLDEGIDPGLIRAGLAKLRAKPSLSPGVLPSLVHEAQQQQAHPGRHPPDPRQQATDEMFDQALSRARARDAQEAG